MQKHGVRSCFLPFASKNSFHFRPLRIEFAGSLYHISSRGDWRVVISLIGGNRGLFLDVLAEAVGVLNWAVHAYCLMDNHYHLLVEKPN